MKLIGAGFGRTGTMSIKAALEMLGYGPCYHMIEVLDRQKNPDHLQRWDAAGQGQPVDWVHLFQDYQSTVGWPAAAFYRELMAAFPQAKVLLSVRDPDRWHESAMSTIFRPLEIEGVDMERFRRMTDNIIFKGTFQGQHTDHDRAVAVFQHHIEQVKQTVPPERLLVFDVREGWEPLCRFLEVPVPQAPFPKHNTTADFQAGLDVPAKG